jgi:hypothetical protein
MSFRLHVIADTDQLPTKRDIKISNNVIRLSVTNADKLRSFDVHEATYDKIGFVRDLADEGYSKSYLLNLKTDAVRDVLAFAAGEAGCNPSLETLRAADILNVESYIQASALVLAKRIRALPNIGPIAS